MLKRKAKRLQRSASKQADPPAATQLGFGTEIPPQHKLVDIYFDQKGFAAQAAVFYSFYEQANWCSPKGTPHRNWKLLAADWIFEFGQLVKLRRRQRENRLSGN